MGDAGMAGLLDVGRRVVVVGPSNSGKSTVATLLAEALDVPVIDLDAIHWEPGWESSRPEVFRTRLLSLLVGEPAGAGFVAAGNYREVQDLAWEHADTVVWLDLPLPVTLWRTLRRSWERSRSPSLLWGTNRERFWPHLAPWNPASLLRWNIVTHCSRRRRYESAMRDPRWRGLRFVRIRSTRGVRVFLRDVGVPV